MGRPRHCPRPDSRIDLKILRYPRMDVFRTLWVCLLIVFRGAPAFALDSDRSIVQFHHTVWSETDGAPSEINALAQTEDGYLWIGSARGLFRFDGVKFEEYKPQPGAELPSHSIYSLMATPDGGLWVAFEPTGLGFLKDGSLTVFTRPGESPDSPIHSFARDHDGRIWAGTETGLVLREGARWIPIGHDWNLAPEVIRALFVDREGTLWVATMKIIAFLRRGSKTFELGGPVGTGVTTLAQAKDGRVWFADDGSFEVRPVPMGGRSSNAEGPTVAERGLHDLLFDREGALWITRMNSGIVRIRYPERLGNRKLGPPDRELESFDEKDGFSAGFAYKLLEDREGNIWVGCSKGLIRFRQNAIVPVSLPQGYQKLVLHGGEDGEIWIGAVNGGRLLHIRGESLLVEKVGGRASSVFRDSNGDVWWGCDTGIWRQRGTKFDYFAMPKGAEPPHFMYEIFPSRDDGALWLRLGDFGTVHVKQGIWNLSDRPKGVPLEGPSASYHDPSGRVWLGSDAGQVYVLDGEKVTAYSQNDGLDVGRIKVIRGRGQHLWVGGEMGLMFFREGRFRKVTVAAGEQFGAVSGIIETSDDGLWLNEMKGIVQIPPEEIRRLMADPNHRIESRRFDYQDGLPGAPQMSFTNSTAVEASDGKLWFATDNGLAWIDPKHIVRNGVPPPVSILSIGNEEGRQPVSSAVKFSAGTHAVQIDYTALSLSIPERVEFRYKLEGSDTAWRDAGTRRQAFYTNLGPGFYRFRVLASNNDGVWNETGATLDFSIAPAFYQAIWFQLLCWASGGAIVWLAYLLRLKHATAQIQGRLEERLAERERIARELHDTFLQGIQALMWRFQAGAAQIPVGEPARQLIESALDRADEVIVEGRDRVKGLRKAEEKYSDLAETFAIMNAELAKEHAIPFQIILQGTPRALNPIVCDDAYQIGREALVNAFRHSLAQKIETEITFARTALRLRVRDNGCGVDSKILEDGGRPGHWGMRGMRERARKIGARLDIWSRQGNGTEVDLRIPASIAYRGRAKGWRWPWSGYPDREGNNS
jgi:signal transduction histidine kinase/ligand-binding sensor domain-containing protein